MGETKKTALRVGFARSLKLEFHGSKVASDAERLCVGSTMRRVVGGRTKRRNAASRSYMGRLETEVLTQPHHGGAVEQGREERGKVDTALVP